MNETWEFYQMVNQNNLRTYIKGRVLKKGLRFVSTFAVAVYVIKRPRGVEITM